MKYIKAIAFTIDLACTRIIWEYNDGSCEKYGFVGFKAAWDVATIIYL